MRDGILVLSLANQCVWFELKVVMWSNPQRKDEGLLGLAATYASDDSEGEEPQCDHKVSKVAQPLAHHCLLPSFTPSLAITCGYLIMLPYE